MATDLVHVSLELPLIPIHFLHVAWTKSVRKNDWRRRKRWHAGDVSASPEQGEVCELAAGVTRALQAMPLSAREHAEKL
jgi:hypothetical protein